MIPVAQRVVGENNESTLRIRETYARALYGDSEATLDDLREALMTLEGLERTARRVLGGANPTTLGIQNALQNSRDALRTYNRG